MSVLLEIFETDARAAPDQIILDPIAFERERVSTFDKGYRAGWEEAQTTLAADAERSKADLAQHLQTLSFTYHEAQAHVLTALQPLLCHLVGQVLPQIARETLAPIVVETLIPLADRLGQVALMLRVHPSTLSTVQTLLEARISLPLTILPDATLGKGQVHLQLGPAEGEVNLDQTTTDIATAVHGFFDLHGKDVLYG